ncbi:MAG: helix-turn-helix transcriptional regulator, partial [Candidatus Cryosericum sp.]
KKLRKYGIEPDTSLALLCVEEDTPFPMLTMDEEPPAAQRGDLSVDERILPRGMSLFDVIHLGGETLLLILASPQPVAKAELAPAMKRLARAVQKKILSSWKASYSAAYMDFCVTISELKKGCAILKESLAGRIFDGREAVIAVDALTPALPVPAVNVNHLNGITMAAFISGFQDLASTAVRVLDETVSSRNVHELRAVCTRLVAFLISLYREKLHFSDEMFLDRWKAEFETLFSAQAARDWLVAELATVRSIYDGLAGCSVLVRQTVEYLHDNFTRPAACLNEIAGTLGMNGTYLGQKFKKETGKTFLHYLTQYRIEKAKAMLHTGKFKVYEIAEKVGYANSQYFSRIFKEATTMTPHAYMEREGSSVES